MRPLCWIRLFPVYIDYLLTGKGSCELLLGELVAGRQKSRRPCRVEACENFVLIEFWYPDHTGWIYGSRVFLKVRRHHLKIYHQ